MFLNVLGAAFVDDRRFSTPVEICTMSKRFFFKKIITKKKKKKKKKKNQITEV